MNSKAERLLRKWAEAEDRAGPGTTHWEGCESEHPACAALAVLRSLDKAKREKRRLKRELDAMRPVVEAAVAWWRGLVKWSDAEHLRLPLVNTTSDIQKHLARAVADYVAGRTAAREEEET